VHSVNAAASAIEMLPLLIDQAAKRPVVAVELPGFGRSDRRDIDHTPLLMRDALVTTLDWMALYVSAQPVDIVALSLGCEFATEAVLKQPQRCRSLALISPTGMQKRHAIERWEPGRTREAKAWRRLLRRTPLGAALFNGLTTQTSMHWFLSRMWGGSDYDRRLLEHGLRCSRQAGARFAPLDFVSGALFTRGMVERYAALPVPVWVAHGNRGSFTDFDACPAALRRTVFDGGAMPHFERSDEFVEAYERFIASCAMGRGPLKAHPRAASDLESNGGAGGNRTPVRKPSPDSSTCVVL
jgi:pimeloyl-ACP methyl ester carboxylesterase